MVFPFERLRDRLLTAGVSPRRVRRYMAELSDHAADLEIEAKTAGHPQPGEQALKRLGSPDVLAQAMIARTELHSWTARAPWAVFLFGPALLLVMIDFLSIITMVAIVKTIGPATGQVAAGWLVRLAAAFNLMHVYAVPLLLGATVALVATRQRMRPLWPVIGLFAIGCVAGIDHLHIYVPMAPGQHGEISLGASVNDWTLFHVAINLMLTVPLYFAWRRRQSSLAG